MKHSISRYRPSVFAHATSTASSATAQGKKHPMQPTTVTSSTSVSISDAAKAAEKAAATAKAEESAESPTEKTRETLLKKSSATTGKA